MAQKKKTTSPDYDVGRGRPPKHTRFRPGQSGNPGGRRKDAKNFKTLITEVLASEIELTENGRQRSVTLVEALLKKQVQEGLRGDLRAIRDLLDRYERYSGVGEERGEELPDEDVELLERVMSGRRRGPGRGTVVGDGPDRPEEERLDE
ncbi:DUF5681 domain-containing protein [Lutibaculum baratangense]|uniref:DUF5681 domain-containing protein n=1 Tax=Lutibaculum baratangense AMV1 TaxID=631454 RepID=V4RC80_9HYPH|nr:DUF5681 domain-containing protein [Lutibaculum baratangense]ESR23776.1 hypothetical protein N177_3006 [Lutibaculum baratangense AMV1]